MNRVYFDNLVNEERVTAFAKRLIQAQSDLAGTYEKEAVDAAAAIAEEIGLPFIRQHVAENRENLIISLDFPKPGKTLAYVGHIDVVSAGKEELWSAPPYRPWVKDGKLYGRGACDMKGSIAAVLHAAELVKDLPLEGRLMIILNVDEETSNKGIYALEEMKLKADACIIGEPTRLRLCLGYKGVRGYKVRLYGKRTHASRPHLGINPISHAAKIIQRIEAYQREILDQRSHDTLGNPTVNVTTVTSGREINCVPDVCAMGIDRRYLPAENSTCHNEVLNIFSQYNKENPEIRIEVDLYSNCPPGEIAPNHPLVEMSARAVCPDDPQGVERCAFEATCEMKLASDALGGAPAIILGPGNLAQAHTIDEFIEIDQLSKGAAVYAALISEYLAQEV